MPPHASSPPKQASHTGCLYPHEMQHTIPTFGVLEKRPQNVLEDMPNNSEKLVALIQKHQSILVLLLLLSKHSLLL